MPPARVQTGQTNRPSSARVESARNNSARQLSARPASARVRQLSSRSINPSARRGNPTERYKWSPKMGNQNASVSHAGELNCRERRFSPATGHGMDGTVVRRAAWKVGMYLINRQHRHLRNHARAFGGRSSIGEESNLPGTRAAATSKGGKCWCPERGLC